jgi:hypothetical protein
VILRSSICVENTQSVAGDTGIGPERGLITSVGEYEDTLVKTPGAKSHDFCGMICPASINAHTHLELSPFKLSPHGDFVDWVLHLVAERYSCYGDDFRRLVDRCGETSPGKSASLVYTPFSGRPEAAFDFLVTGAESETEALYF